MEGYQLEKILNLIVRQSRWWPAWDSWTLIRQKKIHVIYIHMYMYYKISFNHRLKLNIRKCVVLFFLAISLPSFIFLIRMCGIYIHNLTLSRMMALHFISKKKSILNEFIFQQYYIWSLGQQAQPQTKLLSPLECAQLNPLHIPGWFRWQFKLWPKVYTASN